MLISPKGLKWASYLLWYKKNVIYL